MAESFLVNALYNVYTKTRAEKRAASGVASGAQAAASTVRSTARLLFSKGVKLVKGVVKGAKAKLRNMRNNSTSAQIEELQVATITRLDGIKDDMAKNQGALFGKLETMEKVAAATSTALAEQLNEATEMIMQANEKQSTALGEQLNEATEMLMQANEEVGGKIDDATAAIKEEGKATREAVATGAAAAAKAVEEEGKATREAFGNANKELRDGQKEGSAKLANCFEMGLDDLKKALEDYHKRNKVLTDKNDKLQTAHSAKDRETVRQAGEIKRLEDTVEVLREKLKRSESETEARRQSSGAHKEENKRLMQRNKAIGIAASRLTQQVTQQVTQLSLAAQGECDNGNGEKRGEEKKSN